MASSAAGKAGRAGRAGKAGKAVIDGLEKASDRATESLHKNLRRRGAVPALLTALGVLAVIAAQSISSGLVGLLRFAAQSSPTTLTGSEGIYELQQPDAATMMFAQLGLSLLTVALPFVFGLFVSLWIVAPISDELRLRFVFARSVLAAGIGTVLLFLTEMAIAVSRTIEGTGPVFGNAFPRPNLDTGFLLTQLNDALVTSLNQFIARLPLVMLAGALLWLWWRASERPHAVYGMLDEI